MRRRLRARDLQNWRPISSASPHSQTPSGTPTVGQKPRQLELEAVAYRIVVFTDESRFCVSNADGRVRVWRRRGERFQDNYVMELDLNKQLRFFCCSVYICNCIVGLHVSRYIILFLLSLVCILCFFFVSAP